MKKNLQRKLWRELWHIRAQVLAIMLVIVGGVGVCFMSLTTYDSLKNMRDQYYLDYSFANIFASLKRAPDSLLQHVSSVEGVKHAEGRVVAFVTLEVDGFNEPISGMINSLDKNQQLNKLFLLRGRYPDPARDDEALISDAFAEKQQLLPGSRISAIINGKRKDLKITGIALSPEYIYQIAPGAAFPDYQRFGVLWMDHKALATAYGMEGAFNSLLIQTVLPDEEDYVRPETLDIIDQVDRLLEPYGSHGAYDRRYQHSNQFLREEFSQLESMAFIFPSIFLSVAAFLLSVVVGRIINNQREIIAVLKAFGYSNLQVALHYWQMIMVIVGLGIIGGFALGAYLGELMTATYADYYRFPYLLYRIHPHIIFLVAGITVLVATLGTLRAVSKAANLPPAEAMRPEAPELFRRTLLEALGLQRYLNSSGKMMLRNLEKKPIKTLLTILGLSMATAIMMVGNFQQDSVNYIIFSEFKLSQQHDVEVVFNEVRSRDVVYSLENLEGVLFVEGSRSLPVKLMNGHREYRTAVLGLDKNTRLQKVLDTKQNEIKIPERGLLISEFLAEKLAIKKGQTIEVEVLEGKRVQRQVVVADLSKQFMGLGVYADLDYLNRMVGEGDSINRALLSVDENKAEKLYGELREFPAIATINLRKTVIESFEETLDRILLVFTFINAMLGGVIAFGVVYNTVRIALSERGRELASLRVLGYSHAEVSSILLGELFILTMLSLPIGFIIGAMLCQFMADNIASDLFRIPLILSLYTFSFSALIVLLSALFSSVLVWYRMKSLDLVEVLKTRE